MPATRTSVEKDPSLSDTTDKSLILARLAAQAADDKQGTNTIVLNVGEVLAITELFVVTSANNSSQVRTIANEVSARIRERLGLSPLHSEGISEQQWILLDYGDVVIHIFSEPTRQFYEIERLYTDVPVVNWRAIVEQ
ncbi:MAG: ribosome silencing factor [Ilumatobacteraceae bacterium]